MADHPYDEVVSQSDLEAWITAHNTGIGASEIAAVLGENPYQSRIRVWANKTGLLTPDDLSDVEPVQWGLKLEPLVAERYQEATGRPVERAGALLRSASYPWLICTPDYWLAASDGVDTPNTVPLQIKTTGAWRLNDWAEGPPKPVWWQVQQEMLVTGAPWASVAVLVGGQRFLWADVERDEAAIARIVEEGAAFWELVKAQQVPEPDYTDDATAVLGQIYSQPTDEDIYLPGDAIEWADKIEALDESIKAAKAEADQLKNRVRAAMGNASVGIFPDGTGGYTNKEQSRKAHEVKASTFRVLRRFKAVS